MTASVTANTDLARRYIEEVWSQGNVDRIDDFLAPDYMDRSQGHTREQVKGVIGQYRAAFPDLRLPIDEVLGSGEAVAVRYTTEGTHAGAFMGLPATGKRVNAPAMVFYHIRDGKIAESWGLTDVMGLMRQLGVALGPPAGGDGRAD